MTVSRLTLSAGLVTSLLALHDLPVSAHPRPYRSLHHLPVMQSASLDVARANTAARIEPASSAFANAEQVYAFTPGSLYQVYTTIGKVTDIALQPGEHLTGSGPVAAGDTARWIIGSTDSGSGETLQTHILVKPTLPNLTTNLVINSDRRTYHIELSALTTTYMSSVSWRYPQDVLIAIKAEAAKDELVKSQTPVATGIDLTQVNFAYRLDGDSVAWRPLRSFDDGARVYIEMPPSSAGTELPPLFLIGTDNKAELVNYRVQSNFLIVDHLFERAELRLGDKGHQKVVRIVRLGGKTS